MTSSIDMQSSPRSNGARVLGDMSLLLVLLVENLTIYGPSKFRCLVNFEILSSKQGGPVKGTIVRVPRVKAERSTSVLRFESKIAA